MLLYVKICTDFSVRTFALRRILSQITSTSKRPIFPPHNFTFLRLSRWEFRRRDDDDDSRECGTHSRCCCPGFDVFHSFFRLASRNATSFRCVRLCTRVSKIFRGTPMNREEKRRKCNVDPSSFLSRTYEVFNHPEIRAVLQWSCEMSRSSCMSEFYKRGVDRHSAITYYYLSVIFHIFYLYFRDYNSPVF